MEFVHKENDASRPVVSVRVNWYYRPKDIGRKVHDTRHVFATMHSDVSPLTSLRGKCQIRHRVEIEDMELYRKTPDSFWYEKLYDRYIQKNYDLIPTSTIVNVPEKVKKVLDERWKYVLVEQGRGKELTSAVKLCRRCSGYCARYVVFRTATPSKSPSASLTTPLLFPLSLCRAPDCEPSLAGAFSSLARPTFATKGIVSCGDAHYWQKIGTIISLVFLADSRNVLTLLFSPTTAMIRLTAQSATIPIT